MRRRFAVNAFAVALTLAAAGPAAAFDTAPHADVSRDALTAEGFGSTAVDVANVNNWWVDLYSNATKLPHSGHASLGKELLGGALGHREHWPDNLVEAALNSHYDSTLPRLATADGAQAELDRLNRATANLARETLAHNRPLDLLTVVGMSLHELEDFYAHSSWIDPQGVPGADGPDWAGLGYGGTPTWDDVPRAVRLDSQYQQKVYAGGTPGHSRVHGGWNSDRNRSVRTALNKDWQGRPGYPGAYIAAYFAARQWVRGLRAVVNDDAFWGRAQRFADRRGGQLAHDLGGMVSIGTFSGHWQGQGEPCDPSWRLSCGARNGPGGNLVSLRFALNRYFEFRGRTVFRRAFERLMVGLGNQFPTGVEFPLAPTADLQRSTRFVRLQVLSMHAIGLGDPGPDDADLYARATIAGQAYLSGEINSHDDFSFRRPQAPFAFIKAIPAGASFAEPVTSMQIQVRTSSAPGAGTDDDVYLRVNGRRRFALDKRLYDDFERGDRDTYSVPIDDAVRAGLSVGQIDRVALEKSRDGRSGAWRLRGVKLIVNGRQVYTRDGIEQWLRGSSRVWRAPDFVPARPAGPAAGVTLDLFDDDSGPYGADDHGDLERFDRRRTIATSYAPGPVVQRTVRGGSALRGRLGDSDSAKVTYKLDTLDPVPPAPPPPVFTPTPPPAGSPPSDLVISAMGFDMASGTFVFTVANRGAGPAGPFTVNVPGFGAFTFTGLAAGASATRTYSTKCVLGRHEAIADSLGQVAETDETNNTGTFTEDFCGF